jgi:hypothetical protein
LLDPASAVLLADASSAARDADQDSRELAESNLTRALRAAFDDPEAAEDLRADPVGEDLFAELSSACRRVELARRFNNDAVRAAGVVRRKRVVRVMRLAGRAPMPPSFEMDDATPPALVP